MKNFFHLTPTEWKSLSEQLADWVPIYIGKGQDRREIGYYPPLLGQ